MEVEPDAFEVRLPESDSPLLPAEGFPFLKEELSGRAIAHLAQEKAESSVEKVFELLAEAANVLGHYV